jgi:hypothetical protein
MKNSLLLIIMSALAWTASGCTTAIESADGALGSAVEATTPAYVPIVEFDDSAYQFAWFDIQAKLSQEFDEVCGDTFCEGDYANLTPLSMMCAVSSDTGAVQDCAWNFAGSLEAVDSHTSAISVDKPTYQCHFQPDATAADFVDLMESSSDAIHETLPGTTGSIYDSLVDCFQHPIGSTPVTFSNDPHPVYVEADNYYVSPTYLTKLRNAKAALKTGFDGVCGDTFCESDYSDMQSMAFVCSITKSTGNVKGCDWIFAGSYNEVTSGGLVAPTTTSWSCPVTMHGTLYQLITTLDATGSPDPIHRPLPGVTTSAYDQIAGCLP